MKRRSESGGLIPSNPASARKPAGMSRWDWEIYKLWAPSATRGAVNVYHDVHLGDGRLISGHVNSDVRDYWKIITCRRADVIVEYEESALLVELKWEAEPASVGRLLLYQLIWADSPPIPKPAKAMLVTNIESPDIRRLQRAYGFDYEVIPLNLKGSPTSMPRVRREKFGR